MTPRFSIITCSIDQQKFKRYQTMLSAQFSVPFELIHISDAASLCEGYNRGAQQAKAPLLIFCHDDIAILNRDFAQRLQQLLEQYDVVGVAGTSHLTAGKWLNAGFPFLHGQIAHGDPDGAGFRFVLYGCGQDPVTVPDIQGLDGVFMAVRAAVWQAVRFDEATFDGFHLYDLDFSYRAHLQGFRLAVDHRLHLLHFSSGNYDSKWNRYKYLFQKKFKASLQQARVVGLPFYLSQDVSELQDCVYLMDQMSRQVPVSLDPAEKREHFLKVKCDKLEGLGPSQAFWSVAADDCPKGDAARALSEQIWQRSLHGAVLHLQGSVDGVDCFEQVLTAARASTKGKFVKVAGYTATSAQRLFRVDKR